MRFVYLARDLWPVAGEIARHYRKRRFKVQAETQLGPEYRFRPTLVCRKRWDVAAVEVRFSPVIDGTLEDFVKTALARSEALTIYVGLPRERDGDEVLLPASFIDKLRDLGVGLFLVSAGCVEEKERGVRCSLRFSIPPGAGLGKRRARVGEAVRKFNRGDNVDGLRDLTEMVEGAVADLAKRAVARGLLVPSLEEVRRLDFEGLINLLGAPEYRSRPQKRFFDENLKNDLKSFKGARNLGHHPSRTRRERDSLEDQYLERMQGGVRLLREVTRLAGSLSRVRLAGMPPHPAGLSQPANTQGQPGGSGNISCGPAQ